MILDTFGIIGTALGAISFTLWIIAWNHIAAPRGEAAALKEELAALKEKL